MRRIEGLRDIGKRIREIRQSKNLSLRELAEMTDSSATHLSQIETGKVANPGAAILLRIATALEAEFALRPREDASEPSMSFLAPFTLAELQKLESEKALEDVLQQLAADSRLDRNAKQEILGKLVSYARWIIAEALQEGP